LLTANTFPSLNANNTRWPLISTTFLLPAALRSSVETPVCVHDAACEKLMEKLKEKSDEMGCETVLEAV
jgi:hypothetical protein